jgi:hypothetical protein
VGRLTFGTGTLGAGVEVSSSSPSGIWNLKLQPGQLTTWPAMFGSPIKCISQDGQWNFTAADFEVGGVFESGSRAPTSGRKNAR